MCWCLRVYWTVLHNLLVRFVANVGNAIYNNNCCCCCCCCCCNCQKHKQTKLVSERSNMVEACARPDAHMPATTAPNFQHDYVIVDEADADYLEVERRRIETEPYYLIVDRNTAEDILACRADGACLVRPYKETDVCIQYVVSIYAQQQYFHIFIRRICGKEDLYSVGQEKPHEKLFSTPCDIIEFYSYNPLQCRNKNVTLSLILKPIAV